ncbi:Dph6-related ATP pyrophosphatase [Mesonia aquimarina]|uniref:Dph6-related ATP pyrophosphatase n=1 Tax=Mesonia aquimarina TaxID=1504967 RepID=UPI000EF5879A|nr:diphthine--ammonia ligase [Mesonia aquimarina]
MNKTYINWSSGKDAMFALHMLKNQKKYTIEKLVTTVNTDFNRVSMHGLSINLLEQQAEALQIPLHTIPLSGNVSIETYNTKMKNHVQLLKKEGFTHAIFGDIFLEDLKAYREKELLVVNLQPVFPLWKKNTHKLITEFIQLGYKAIVVCTSAKYLDESFCGRIIDNQFLNDLPSDVDPCGENGEFHTFVFDGPLFYKPVRFKLGEKVLRDYTPSDEDDCFKEEKASWDYQFWYQDLILG